MRFIAVLTFLICCFLFVANVSLGQKISGRVLNEYGKKVANVTVQFSNKSGKAVTDKDGKFTIIAKKLPDTLFFTSPTLEPYKVIVTEQTAKDSSFEVVLLFARDKIPATPSLSEVTITGYSDEKISSPKKDDAEYRASKGDISGALAGKLSGMYVTTASGEYLAGKKLYLMDSIPAKTNTIIYKSGLLTAGEVNDFNKWKMWEDFQEGDFKKWSDHWGMYPKHRYTVQVQNKDHIAAIGEKVFLINKITRDTVWSAITDNTGKAELWANMDGRTDNAQYVLICKGAADINSPSEFANGINRMELNIPCSVSSSVDIAFVVDATGSMSDEIEFLKLELEEALRKTISQFSDLDFHASSVFYRDNGDEYISEYIDFQTDLLRVLNFIKLHRAGGGGDNPEAVHVALKAAIDSMHWSENARTRILFLVLDAPPHDEAKKDIYDLTQKAAAKGIRIIPVVCSGAEKTTEFLMRSMALATNGTYLFLTDNSGIGNSHIKPSTDAFTVEFLNALLPRVITEMITANKCSEQKEIETFRNTPPNIEKIRIYPNPSKGNVMIESKSLLKEIFITDFTGKILQRIETSSKQNKYSINLTSYPNATYLVKYITMNNEWGAEKVVLIH